MTHDDARAELAELQVAHHAHGELAAMHQTLNACEALLMNERAAEAEAVVQSCWTRCQEMRAAFMARPYTEHVAGVLAAIETAQDQALVWRDIVANLPPGWAEWRRGEHPLILNNDP